MQVYLSMYGLSSLTFVPSVSWTDTSPTEIRILLKSIQKHIQNRNSCPEVFYKTGVLRNFAKFTGKHLKLQLSGLQL